MAHQANLNEAARNERLFVI